MSANIVSVDEESLRNDIKNLVRKTVEETLNALLDEASELVGAERYEDGGPGGLPQRPLHEEARHGRRGSRAQRAEAPRGDLPDGRHRALPQARDLGRGGHRRDVPGGRLHQEDRGRLRAPVGSAGVLRHRLQPQREAFASIETWRQRPLEGGYLRLRRRYLPQAQLGRVLRERGRAGRHRRQLRRRPGGHRLLRGYTESAESWREFFSWLKGRGLSGVRLVTGDKCAGMLGALEEVFPGARYQRCTVHFYRNVLGRVPVTRRKAAARMLKAIHAQESREACARKAEEAEELESMRLGAAARTVRDGFAETLAYTEFPPEHWRRIRTNNGIERINREIRRRTRVVGTFPDGNSALMLVTARLVHSGARVGQEEVLGHVEAGGDGRAEGKGGGLEEDGAGDG